MEQHKLEQKKQIFFKNLLKDLVSPAYGCTEIGCVALACSAAAEHLKGPVVSAKLHVSSYIYRNDANVGVPKLGQVGIKTIAAAGFIVKQSKKKLLVLSSITDAQAKLAKQNSKQNFIDIIIEKHRNPVYAKVIAKDKFNNTCEVLIERKHDNIKRITLNNKLVAVNTKTKASNVHTYKYNVDDISLNDVYYGVQNFTINDVKFLRDGLMMNKKVMNYGEKHREGFTKVAMAGYSFNETNWKNQLLTSIVSSITARMVSCPLPVMASNDSGDHGLTVNLPQWIYHTCCKTSELTMLKATALANLITWKIKKNIGSLSAYCGSVVAAVSGTICGLGYQRNYSIKQINDVLNLCLCSSAGSLCDGAKLSCAWKIEAAIVAGFAAMDVVESKIALPDNEGLVNRDAFETIKSIGILSRGIMNDTNSIVVDIIDKNERAK